MSKFRTSVEWGKSYLVVCILINCHTCLYGSVKSSYSNIDPPNLEKYLTNTWEIFNAHLTVLNENCNITGKYIFILSLCPCLYLYLKLVKKWTWIWFYTHTNKHNNNTKNCPSLNYICFLRSFPFFKLNSKSFFSLLSLYLKLHSIKLQFTLSKF